MSGDETHTTSRGRRRSEFDHTGDLGIEVEAESLAAVFEEAAFGMFGLLTDLETVLTTKKYNVDLRAADPQTLLLDWLSELNFLHLTERIVFRSFSIRAIGENHLEATVEGEPIDLNRHKIHTEIKAVTYHGMVVEQRGDRWYARVIFDI